VTNDPAFDAQHDRKAWAPLKARLTEIFKSKTRAEWCAIMEATDVCFAPVLAMHEAPEHPHSVARQTFIKVGGAIQPAPAPRYSVTTNDIPVAAPVVGSDAASILAGLGYGSEKIASLEQSNKPQGAHA
jgi:alpha-methylacyl-CoA racemase